MKRLNQLLWTLAITVAIITAFVPTTTAQENSNSLRSAGRYLPFVHKRMRQQPTVDRTTTVKTRPNVVRTPLATTRSGVAPISVSRSPYRIGDLPGVAPAVARPDSAFYIRIQEGDRILDTRNHFTHDGLGRLTTEEQFYGWGEPLLVDANNNPIGSIGSHSWTDFPYRLVTDYRPDGSYQTTYYSGGQLHPSDRIVEAYDTAGRETFYENWLWDGEELVCQVRSIHQYDALGNELLNESYYRENGLLVGQRKYSSTYDANGNCTSETEYRWNSVTQTFDNDYQWVYTYDAAGYPATYYQKVWNGSEWQITRRAIFSAIPGAPTPTFTAPAEQYMGNGWQSIGYLTFTYLNSPQTPLIMEMPFDRTVFTYDSENRETSSKYYYKERADWVLDEESETHYDSAGRIIDSQAVYSGGGWRTQSAYTAAGSIQEKIEYYRNGTTWIPNRRDTYTYDSSDRCTSYLWEYWDEEQGSYLGNEKKVRTYDSAGRILTEVFFQQMSSNQLSETGTYRYFYGESSSIDKTFDATAVRIYTTSGAIVVKGVDNCTIYTLAGIQISRSVSGATQQADGSVGNRITVFVPSGTYIVCTTKGAVKVVVP